MGIKACFKTSLVLGQQGLQRLAPLRGFKPFSSGGVDGSEYRLPGSHGHPPVHFQLFACSDNHHLAISDLVCGINLAAKQSLFCLTQRLVKAYSGCFIRFVQEIALEQ